MSSNPKDPKTPPPVAPVAELTPEQRASLVRISVEFGGMLDGLFVGPRRKR